MFSPVWLQKPSLRTRHRRAKTRQRMRKLRRKSPRPIPREGRLMSRGLRNKRPKGKAKAMVRQRRTNAFAN